jgi:glutaredoxin
MKNKILISTILFIGILIFSLVGLFGKNPSDNPLDEQSNIVEESEFFTADDQIILFYGKGCPYCVVVEKYIKENDISQKISFLEKEVYFNKNNARELEAKAKKCGLSSNSFGVPFLWDGQNCLIGDRDIINFFKQKTDE